MQRYQVGTGIFLASFSIGSSLDNVDISPDGSLLAIADQTTRTNASFYLLNLNSTTVQQVVLNGYSGDVNSLAFGSDGAVICEVGNVVFRYDPVSGTTTTGDSVSSGAGPMTASADRSTIAIASTGDSAGLVYTYNVANEGIDGFIWSNDYITSPPELSSDGSLIAEPTRYGLPIFVNSHSQDYSGDYIALIGSPSGEVFSPNQDLLFLRQRHSTIGRLRNDEFYGVFCPEFRRAHHGPTNAHLPGWLENLRCCLRRHQLDYLDQHGADVHHQARESDRVRRL